MTPRKRILDNFARLQPAGFAQLTLFLGIILLATPLRQERWLFWVLRQLMFLDALLVSLSASDTQPCLCRAFWGVWAAGFGANLGATLASSVEATRWWNIATLSLTFVRLSRCIIVGLVYIFRSQRVTVDVMVAAVSVHLLIAFSFAVIYSIAFQLDFRSLQFPEWVDTGSASVPRTEMVFFSVVTLATLGYGDTLPSFPFTRVLGGLEAVIGQFFMAVLVTWVLEMCTYDNFTGGR